MIRAMTDQKQPTIPETRASHPSNKITRENLDQVFGYQKPTPDTIPRFAAIERRSKIFAAAILELAPDCAFRSRALSLLVEARMMANAAIATSPAELLPPIDQTPERDGL